LGFFYCDINEKACCLGEKNTPGLSSCAAAGQVIMRAVPSKDAQILQSSCQSKAHLLQKHIVLLIFTPD